MGHLVTAIYYRAAMICLDLAFWLDMASEHANRWSGRLLRKWAAREGRRLFG